MDHNKLKNWTTRLNAVLFVLADKCLFLYHPKLYMFYFVFVDELGRANVDCQRRCCR